MSFDTGMGSASVSAIGFPGGVPSFPDTDTLESSSFKVVVGSWRRINPATSNSSDFTVDVAAYAPKTPFVNRVQLVDVDIPNTQQLIEGAWSRMYFQQGVPTSPTCRSLDVTFNGDATVSVVLPLLIDAVTMTQPSLRDPAKTRVFLTHCAPWPITAVADVWRHLPGGQGLRIMGLSAFPAGFLLKQDGTACVDAGTMAFDVLSYDFAAAVAAEPTALLCLCAAPIPGPSYLAAMLTKVLTVALALGGGNGGAASDDGDGFGAGSSCVLPAPATAHAQMQFQYSTADDRFALYTRFPRGVDTASMGGQLAEYMGFGSRYALHVPAYGARSPVLSAPNTRFHPKDGYGKLSSDSPRQEIEIAKNLQRSLNAYNWESFTFGVRFPGTGPPSVIHVPVPAGRMTLRQLAEAITEALAALSTGVHAFTTCADDGSKSGICFEHAHAVFALDFSVDAAFDPAKIGYAGVPFPPARVHFPTRTAVHVPLPAADCLPPACDIVVLYNKDTQHISLHSAPFKEFAATISKPDVTHGNVFLVDSALGTGFRHGLRVGARMVVVTPDGTQRTAIVVDVPSSTAFSVLVLVLPVELAAALAAAPPPHSLAVTVVPQDRLPINLFLQCSREKNVFPQMLGFQPLTYEGACDLASPGTLDMRQDPYLLLCLSFQAEDASAQCGHVYYPFETNSQLIFGKIMRSTCTYKADYDRAFFYEFKGAGIHLGYIRVRILNSDGTLYESHGHPSSVCLRFDVKQSGVLLGGPGSVAQLPSAPYFQENGSSGQAHAQTGTPARAPLTLFHRAQ